MTINFRTIVLGVAIAVAVYTSPAGAQQVLKPEDTARIKVEVDAAMQNYVTAFNRSDSKSIANNSFTSPSVAMGPNGVSTRTPEQIDQQYADTTKRLAETGWVKSVGGRYSICVINANTALFNGRFDRLRRDGSVLTETATTYLFTKGKDGWRIAALFGHATDKIITCSE